MTHRAAATRYARALFDVVLAEKGDVAAAERDLQPFAELVATNATLREALGNPAIPASKKRAVIEAILAHGRPQSQPVHKLILLLADRDRLLLLPAIAELYRERLLEHQRVVRGEVTTAVPLAPEKVRALQEALGRATGRTVQLDARVDPSIIGGVVTRIGSTVFDGSVTTQLQKMKQALVENAQ